MHNLTGSFIQECTEKKRIQGKNISFSDETIIDLAPAIDKIHLTP